MTTKLRAFLLARSLSMVLYFIANCHCCWLLFMG